LDDDALDALVAYIRSWEQKPPVELPPEVAATPISRTGAEIFAEVCAQCHGATGEGQVGPALREPEYQAKNTDQDIFDTINQGHGATAMIAWGEILSSDQIDQLVKYIRQLGGTVSQQPTGAPSFTADVLPILKAQCAACHGTLGGWDAASYELVMTSGDHAPAVVPGDVEGSLLAQKILGKQTQGAVMPPAGLMPHDQIQIILDWIAAGAPEK
ncbi:MAG TPA: c-type cytochrome, partial [Anaerolineae bacterium]|nr:c-type cytochrome [Anaerolineae bacterium]